MAFGIFHSLSTSKGASGRRLSYIREELLIVVGTSSAEPAHPLKTHRTTTYGSSLAELWQAWRQVAEASRARYGSLEFIPQLHPSGGHQNFASLTLQQLVPFEAGSALLALRYQRPASN